MVPTGTNVNGIFMNVFTDLDKKGSGLINNRFRRQVPFEIKNEFINETDRKVEITEDKISYTSSNVTDNYHDLTTYTDVGPHDSDVSNNLGHSWEENSNIHNNTIVAEVQWILDYDTPEDEVEDHGPKGDDDDIEKYSNSLPSLSTMFFFEPILSPETWHHICFSYDVQSAKVRFNK